MKNLIILIFTFSIFILLAGGCGGKKGNTDNKDQPVNSGDACKKFLNEYEAWVDDYTKIRDEVDKNPGNTEYTKKLSDLTGQLNVWTTKWAELTECNNDSANSDKYIDISTKIRKKSSDD